MELSTLPSQEPSSQIKGKGFGVRAGAYIIDVIVIWLATLVISFITGVFLGIFLLIIGQDISYVEGQAQGLDFLLGIVISTLYFVIFEWLYGATPGKLIMGMRVVMEDGKACTFRSAFIRALFRYIDGLLFGIPALYSMKEPLLQRIGDRSAKTIVINARDSYIHQNREWWWFLLALAIYLGIDVIASIIQLLPGLS